MRADRTSQSGKERGNRVCTFINKRWCTNIKIHCTVCSSDVEQLTLSLHPLYFLREFPTVVISCVYIPPSANTRVAAELVAEGTNSLLAKYPDAPLWGISTVVHSVVLSFHQYVDIPTRRHNTLDLCHSNITNLFRAQAHPPLGHPDHSIVSLLPHYKLKQTKVTQRKVISL